MQLTQAHISCYGPEIEADCKFTDLCMWAAGQLHGRSGLGQRLLMCAEATSLHASSERQPGSLIRLYPMPRCSGLLRQAAAGRASGAWLPRSGTGRYSLPQVSSCM